MWLQTLLRLLSFSILLFSKYSKGLFFWMQDAWSPRAGCHIFYRAGLLHGNYLSYPYFRYVSWYFLLNAACKLFLLVAIVSSSVSSLEIAKKPSKDACFSLVLLVYGFNISFNVSRDWKKHLDMRPEWVIGGCNREKFSISFFNIKLCSDSDKNGEKSKFLCGSVPNDSRTTGGWGQLLYRM